MVISAIMKRTNSSPRIESGWVGERAFALAGKFQEGLSEEMTFAEGAI